MELEAYDSWQSSSGQGINVRRKKQISPAPENRYHLIVDNR